MKPRFVTALTVAAVLLSAEARAARLVTAPIFLGTGQAGLAHIANVGTKPITDVRIVCRNIAGSSVTNASSPMMQPGASFNPGLPTGGGSVYCEFSAEQGARSIRASVENTVTGAVSEAR